MKDNRRNGNRNYDHGHRSRLREKFLAVGRDGLHDYEMLELLLTYAIPRHDVKPVAKELLSRFGNLNGVLDAEVGELCEQRGIGTWSACLIKLVRALMASYLKAEAKRKVTISSPRDLADFISAQLGGLKEEQFCVIYLDSQNHLMEMDTLQRGTVNQAIVYPRQVLERALERKASCLILVHNHPSGTVTPSEADIRLTKAVVAAARTMDIIVHDHIILGDGTIYSFREEGLMPMM